MLMGSPLEGMSLEEVSSLPTDAVNGRVVFFGDKVYVYKRSVGNWIELASSDSNGEVPVGTILPFYDFDGTVSFDTDIYEYCNGGVVSNAGSPLNGLTKPDMSGRYMVGFGTDGGADNGSASWATDAVGNAGHQIDLKHIHNLGYTYNDTVKFYNSDGATLHDGDPYSTFYAAAGGEPVAQPKVYMSADQNYSDDQLSATQSIQPRSIRVRFIIRVK